MRSKPILTPKTGPFLGLFDDFEKPKKTCFYVFFYEKYIFQKYGFLLKMYKF